MAKSKDVITQIKKATRRKFSADEKIRIVLEGLRGRSSISEVCRQEGIATDLHLAGQRPTSRPRPERLTLYFPAAIGLTLEIGNQNVLLLIGPDYSHSKR